MLHSETSLCGEHGCPEHGYKPSPEVDEDRDSEFTEAQRKEARNRMTDEDYELVDRVIETFKKKTPEVYEDGLMQYPNVLELNNAIGKLSLGITTWKAIWFLATKAQHQADLQTLDNFRILHEQDIAEAVKLAEDCLLMAEHGDYANGVGEQGVDEGQMRSREILKSLRQRIEQLRESRP